MPWLLIFDNADDMDGMSQYIPASSQGSVILTSRRRDIIIPGSLEVEVAPFDSETGAGLLNSLMQSEDSSGSAREVANQLGGHPLAISQAVGYMKMAATTCSEFLELYKKRQLKLSDTSDTRWIQGSIHSLFETTLAPLSSDARRLLECMAVMDPDQIPEELFLQDIEDVTVVQKYVPGSTLRSPSYCLQISCFTSGPLEILFGSTTDFLSISYICSASTSQIVHLTRSYHRFPKIRRRLS